MRPSVHACLRNALKFTTWVLLVTGLAIALVAGFLLLEFERARDAADAPAPPPPTPPPAPGLPWAPPTSEIARALASDPPLLLLDEPAAGMNPQETDTLMDLIRKVRSHGITVLLIEHDMDIALAVASRVIVMHDGEKILEGTPDEIRASERVREIYLGGSIDHAA